MIKKAPSLFETLKLSSTTQYYYLVKKSVESKMRMTENDWFFRRMIYLKIATKKILFYFSLLS